MILPERTLQTKKTMSFSFPGRWLRHPQRKNSRSATKCAKNRGKSSKRLCKGSVKRRSARWKKSWQTYNH